MVEITAAQFALALLSMLLLTVLGAMLAFWGWMLFRLATGQRLLPSQPLVSLQSPPWRGGTVLLAFMTYVVINSVVGSVYVRAQGRVPRKPALTAKSLEKSKLRLVAKAPADQPGSKPGLTESKQSVSSKGSAAKRDQEKSQKTAKHAGASATTRSSPDEGPLSRTEQMFLVSVINCVLMVVLPLLIRATSSARLRDVGLSFRAWELQAAVGVVATMIAAPVVYSIQFAAIRVWKPNPHALEKMLLNEFDNFGVADLAIISAVVLAPIVEEIMFRGLLQRWCIDFLGRLQRWCIDLLARRVWPGNRKPEPSSAVADSSLVMANGEAWSRGLDALPAEKPASQRLHSPSQTAVVVGIILPSLIFALVHFDQWPAPIPLFALALVIGTVYYRTGSLIAAIAMHATFNGFSTLAMFVAILAGNEEGAAKAIEGVWQAPGVVAEVGQGVYGAVRPHGLLQIRNSGEFLVDERVSD